MGVGYLHHTSSNPAVCRAMNLNAAKNPSSSSSPSAPLDLDVPEESMKLHCCLGLCHCETRAAIHSRDHSSIGFLRLLTLQSPPATQVQTVHRPWFILLALNHPPTKVTSSGSFDRPTGLLLQMKESSLELKVRLWHPGVPGWQTRTFVPVTHLWLFRAG